MEEVELDVGLDFNQVIEEDEAAPLERPDNPPPRKPPISAARADDSMEEGEISDGGETDVSYQRGTRGLRGARGSGGLSGRFDRQLPDLLKEIGDFSSTLDRGLTEKMSRRAKRFNLDKSAGFGFEDVEKVYKSLKIPETEEEERKNYRLEAVHIQISTKNVTSNAIYAYFKDFSPVSFEWVTAKSANIIWASPAAAAKTILALSRPLPETEEDEDAMEVNVIQSKAEDEEEKEGEVQWEELKEKFGEASDSLVCLKTIGGNAALPKKGVWRIGKPHEDFKGLIFMRFAKWSDTNDENEIRNKNIQLRNEGGIISSSRKRRLQEVFSQEQEAIKEDEKFKKYQGPVGKNPWGSIAEAWSGNRSKNSENEDPRSLYNNTDFRDWDAPGASVKPEEDLRKRMTSGRSRLEGRLGGRLGTKRRRSSSSEGESRRLIRRESSESSSSEEDETEDSRWNKKLKKPRMSMVADEIESKVSAKSRLFKGLKRKVTNPKPSASIEIYEEEEEEEIEPEKEKEENTRLTMSVMSIENRTYQDPTKKRLSERFGNNLGAKMRLRLGDKVNNDEADLENDEGFASFKKSSNMKIVVPHSEPEDEEMEDLPPPRPSVVSSVVKIKQEKIDDAREKIRQRRDHKSSSRKEDENRRDRRLSDSRREDRSSRRSNTDNIARKRQELEEIKTRLSEKRLAKSSSSTKKQPSSSSRSKLIPSSKIKKEKKIDQDDSDSSSSDSDSDSSSSDSSSDSDSSSSDSDSDSSSSDSDSSSSDSDSSSDSEDDRKRKRKAATSSRSKLSSKSVSGSRGGGDRRRREERRSTTTSSKLSSSRKRHDEKKDRGKKSDSSRSKSTKESSSSSGGLRDKLKEYLKQAKERKK